MKGPPPRRRGAEAGVQPLSHFWLLRVQGAGAYCRRRPFLSARRSSTTATWTAGSSETRSPSLPRVKVGFLGGSLDANALAAPTLPRSALGSPSLLRTMKVIRLATQLADIGEAEFSSGLAEARHDVLLQTARRHLECLQGERLVGCSQLMGIKLPERSMPVHRRQSVPALVIAAAAAFGVPNKAAAGAEGDFSAKPLFYDTAGVLVSIPSASTRAQATPHTVTHATVSRKGSGASRRAGQTVLAMRGSVLLFGADGGTREVKPSRVFRSGDRIKVAFTSNRAGYLYVISVGSTGKAQLIAPRGGETAAIQPGYKYQFPKARMAHLRFDHQPGTEEIWAVLSDHPLDVVRLDIGQLVSVVRPDVFAQSSASSSSPVMVDAGGMLASKELIFEEDVGAAYASMRPNTAAIGETALPTQMVTLKMSLTHRP